MILFYGYKSFGRLRLKEWSYINPVGNWRTELENEAAKITKDGGLVYLICQRSPNERKHQLGDRWQVDLADKASTPHGMAARFVYETHFDMLEAALKRGCV
jgi:hypothetical protein